MAGPATLYEYYTSQGQAMPSLDARAAAYESAGLGKAADYIAQNKAGSVLPNQTLLAYLTSGTAPKTGPAAGPNPLVQVNNGSPAPANITNVGTHNAVDETGPQWSPSGGVGTTYTEGNGTKWKYTATGWVKDGAPAGNATGGGTGGGINPVNVVTPEYTEDQRMQKFIDAMSQAGLDMGTIANKMLGELGSASSTNEIDNFVTKTADYWEKYMQENRAAAEAQFGRESDYTLRKMEAEKTAAQEQGRGNAQQFYAYQLMDREIEKSVRDLESRKMQAIAEGNSKAYEAMSNLQVKQLEYRQQARQNYISGLANVATVYGKQQDIYKGVMDTIRGMNSDRLTYEMNTARNKIDMAKNAADAANESLRLKIMEREVKVKEIEAGNEDRLTPPGWSDYKLYSSTIGKIQQKMSDLIGRVNPDEEPETYFKEMVSIFNNAVTIVGPNGTKESIAEAMGLQLDARGNPVQIKAGDYIITPTSSGKDENSPLWDALSSSGAAGGPLNFIYPGSALMTPLWSNLIINPKTGEATTTDGKPVIPLK